VFGGTGLFGPVSGLDAKEQELLDQQVTAAIGSKSPNLSMIPAFIAIVWGLPVVAVPSSPQLQCPAT
jgi:hypothetical protein